MSKELSDDDIMLEMTIRITRSGIVMLKRELPSGPIHCDKVIAVGMLDVANRMIEFKLIQQSPDEL